MSGEYYSKTADAAKGADATVTLKNKNYTFSGGDVAKSFFIYESDNKAEITKAAAPTAKSGEIKIYNNRTADYRFDVTELLPELETGKSLGTVKYSQALTLTNDKYTVTQIELNEQGQLSLRTDAPNETSEGAIGFFTIMVQSENYQDFNITVTVNATNRLVPTGEPTPSSTEITYGDNVGSISLSGNMKYGDKDVTGTFEWINGSAKPDAGTYDAQWRFIPDYTVYSEVIGNVTITVNKADCAYVAPMERSLTYSGAEQELVTAGTVSGGTIYYSLDNSSWSENVPKKTNADSYKVYYKLVGDKNHKDVSEQLINVSIAKLPVIIKWNNTENLVYDGNAKTISAEVTNKAGSDSVNITLGGTYSAADKGDYSASAASLDNPNYKPI